MKKQQAKAALKPKGKAAAKPALPLGIEVEQLPDVYATTIAVSLDVSKFGNERKASMSGVIVDADKDRLRMTKELLESEELDAIESFDRRMMNAIEYMTVPSFFKPGIKLVKLEKVGDLDAFLKEQAPARQKLVDAFLDALDKRIDEAQVTLRSLFNRGDYPTRDEMKSYFAFSWRYLNLGAPDALSTVDAKLYQEQRASIAATVQAVAQEIRQNLRGAMAEVVTKLTDQLKANDKNGKPVVFKQASLNRLNLFLAHFEDRDITGDADLQALVNQTKQLIAGVDPADLKDTAIRDKMVAAVETVKAAADGLVATGFRAINLQAAPSLMTPARKAAASRKRQTTPDAQAAA